MDHRRNCDAGQRGKVCVVVEEPGYESLVEPDAECSKICARLNDIRVLGSKYVGPTFRDSSPPIVSNRPGIEGFANCRNAALHTTPRLDARVGREAERQLPNGRRAVHRT